MNLLNIPRIGFYSLVVTSINRSIFNIFPLDDTFNEYIPNVEDLNTVACELHGKQDGRLHSEPRNIGEWDLMIKAANGLKRGDILIADGSLNPYNNVEKKRFANLREKCINKGIVMCGLAKTTNIRMNNGKPLVDYCSEVVNHDDYPGYIDIGDDKINYLYQGIQILMVKLHNKINQFYRLDIIPETIETSKIDINDILYSLVMNSTDPTMLGYPYGLLEVDRQAQVRNDESKLAGHMLHQKLDIDIQQSKQRYKIHNDINEVTS